MELRDKVCEVVDWIRPAQNVVHWQALTCMVMYLRIL